MARLLDQFGQPVNLPALTNRQALPTVTGARSRWRQHPDEGLTPQQLGTLLKNAELGDAQAFFELAEKMEEKDLHYRGLLSTRKLAVTGLDIDVHAVSDDPDAVRDADLARAVLNSSAVRLALKDIEDALGKSVSFIEILWETSERDWRPRELVWTDPRWFTFDQATGLTPLLRERSFQTSPLKPYGWIYHRPRLKSGYPITGGLAWCACWAYLFKNFTIKDWLTFAERNASPLRIGKYPAYLREEDPAVQALYTALQEMGSDAAAAIPDNMVIEFVDALKAGSQGNSIFIEFLNWVDRQKAYAILGQYGTSEGTPGQLGNATDKAEVREDIIRDDGRDLAATLEQWLVRPLIDLNHGPRRAYPQVIIQPKEAADRQLLVNALEQLVPQGLAVEQSWVRDQFGIPDPEPGAVLLQPTATNATPRLRQSAHATLPAASPGPAQAAIDGIVSTLLAQSSTQPLPLEALRKAIFAATDPEDLERRLAAVLDQTDPRYLNLLTQAQFAAAILGYVSAAEGQV